MNRYFFVIINFSIREKKWLVTIFFIPLITLGCFSSGRKEYQKANKQLECIYADDSIKVDGQLNEAGWRWAKSVAFEHNSFSSQDSRKSNNLVEVKTLWNTQNLYMAFKVWDNNLQAKDSLQDSPHLSQDDIVEFLIDPFNRKDSCWGQDDIIYHINLLGQKKDGRGTKDCKSNAKWNGKAEYAIQLFGTINDSFDVDTGYIVEIAVSWSEIGIEPSLGLKLGIDFANGDSGIFFDWAGAWPFRSPYAFGDLILSKY